MSNATANQPSHFTVYEWMWWRRGGGGGGGEAGDTEAQISSSKYHVATSKHRNGIWKGHQPHQSDVPSLFIPVVVMGKCKQINNSMLREIMQFRWCHASYLKPRQSTYPNPPTHIPTSTLRQCSNGLRWIMHSSSACALSCHQPLPHCPGALKPPNAHKLVFVATKKIHFLNPQLGQQYNHSQKVVN